MEILSRSLLIVLAACSCGTSTDGPGTPAAESTASNPDARDSLPSRKGELREAVITKGDAYQPEEFLIALTDQTVRSNFSGHLTSGRISKSLGLDPVYYVRRIHFAEDGERVILFPEITNDDWSNSPVFCLAKSGLHTEWTASLHGFYPNVGLAEQHTLYLGGGGQALALDMRSGNILWQTRGLYEREGLDYFETVSITNDEVRFTGSAFSAGNSAASKTITLKKADGTVVKQPSAFNE